MCSTPLLDLIGNTPLVRVTRIDSGCCELYLKLDSSNPGGSIKDCIAMSMITAAEAEGHLKPGGTIIGATAGNTGIALALVGGAKGYRYGAGCARKNESGKNCASAGTRRRCRDDAF